MSNILNFLKKLVPIVCITLSGCATQPVHVERSFEDLKDLGERDCNSLAEELSELVKGFGDDVDRNNTAGAGMSIGAFGGKITGIVTSLTFPAAVTGGLAGGLLGLGYQQLYAKKNRAERDHIDGLLVAFNGLGCADSAAEPQPYKVRALIDQVASGQTISEFSETETLPFPNRCTNANDSIRRSYKILLSGLEQGERLRFFTYGTNPGSRNVMAANLLLGELRLPDMSITSRRGGKKRGLWVERMATGERAQLNYLPVAPHCSSSGLLTVKYDNIWVSVGSLTSSPSNR